jgi:four helix bundle protein
MATIEHHEDLVAWQLATELKERVFEITARAAVLKHRDFCEQIQTSSRSAPANLAEGFWRYRPRDNARFVRIALGSLGETANHLHDAWKENYISEDEYVSLAKLVRRALGITIRWHTYLKHCPDQPSHSQKPRTRGPSD